MKMGVFGGSFDPPHIAHSIIAESVFSKFALDQILWVPSHDPPHKSSTQLTPFSHRIGMVCAAVSEHSAFQVSDIEATLDSPTYTIGMLQSLRKQFSHAQLHLILGSDSLLQFHTWMEPELILEMVQLIVYPRAKYSIEGMTFPEYQSERTHIMEAPMMSLSGTYVRACLKEKRSIRYVVLNSVRDYISHHGLYH